MPEMNDCRQDLLSLAQVGDVGPRQCGAARAASHPGRPKGAAQRRTCGRPGGQDGRQGADGVRLLMTPQVNQEYPELKKLWLDGGYAGQFEEWLKTLGYDVEITARHDGLGAWVGPGEEPAPRQEGFVLQKQRWVIERTFGWPPSIAVCPRITKRPRAPRELRSFSRLAP